MRAGYIFILSALVSVQAIFAGSFHVRVNGTPSGNGSITNPWNLQTALNHPTGVSGGDTIWIHEGTYTGNFTSWLTGQSNAPVIVRAVPGNTVIIDGNVPGTGSASLIIRGEYVYYWGLVITSTSLSRVVGISDIIANDGVDFRGANNKLINCIIHNNGVNGVGFWTPAINSEIYGCIIYNNGYRGTGRGHGHGIYGQNATGTKQVRNNILFNSFGLGIHVYTEGGNIRGFNIEGNIMFNNGLPGNDFLERHILVGGFQPADRVTIRNNYLYNRPNYPSKAGIQLGFGSANVNAEVTGNYMVDGSFYVIDTWNSVRFTGNSLLSRSGDLQLLSIPNFRNIQSPEFNNNSYFSGTLAGLSFDAWKSSSGQDRNSTYSSTLPTTTHVVLQKNQYEPGRGHLVIYNWGRQNSVNVDLSSILPEESEFKIFDVSNLSGGPVVSGTYHGGSIAIPMQLTVVELPRGNVPNDGQFIHTAPAFGVFLISGAVSNGKPVDDPGNPGEGAVTPLRILNFYPNPTVDLVSVEFYSPHEERLTIDVVDASGKLVSSGFFSPRIGKNTEVINLASHPLGFYFITIYNNTSRTSCKVMKKSFIVHSELDPGIHDLDKNESSVPFLLATKGGKRKQQGNQSR